MGSMPSRLVSAPLRAAFASSDFLHPHAPKRSSRSAVPLRGEGDVRSYRVPRKYPSRLGPACTPAALRLRGRTVKPPPLAASRLGQAFSTARAVESASLACLRVTALKRFTYVDRTTRFQLPTALMLAELKRPRGTPLPGVLPAGYSVPGASHHRITPIARPGKIPVAEHRVASRRGAVHDSYLRDFHVAVTAWQ